MCVVENTLVSWKSAASWTFCSEGVIGRQRPVTGLFYWAGSHQMFNIGAVSERPPHSSEWLKESVFHRSMMWEAQTRERWSAIS